MFTHPELWSFASNWYRFLDVHAPLESFKPLMTDDVQCVFPEATVSGFEGYSSWYNNVIKFFFDEEHTLLVADIVNQSETICEVHVVVKWHASIWNAPDASSTRLKMDADQTWELKRTSDGKLAISKYIVNSMAYEPNSCKL